jgi:hypothetical protein
MSACALCGTPAPPKFSVPRPVQPPDLDGRPGEPARSTLRRWILTCRGCGAAAPDLSALPKAAAPVVASSEFLAISGPAAAALRWALIAENLGQTREAAAATLEAAWALEDAEEPAGMLRREAAQKFYPPRDTAEALRLIDNLRRAGAFDEAEKLARATKAPDDSAASILAFELARIAARDAGRHLLSEAIRPPAYRPHVSHGRPAGRGLLKRWFSRGN